MVISTSRASQRCIDDVATWFDLYADELHRYVARRIGPGSAADVVAETFHIAIEHWPSFDPHRGQPRPWLYGIATNLLRRHVRTEQRRLKAHSISAGRAHGPALDPLLDSDGRIDAGREIASIAAAVSALQPEDRDVLILKAWENMTSSEISLVLGIPPGTVRSRLSRVRRILNDARSSAGTAEKDGADGRD